MKSVLGHVGVDVAQENTEKRKIFTKTFSLAQ
jgi:hypothetical protein